MSFALAEDAYKCSGEDCTSPNHDARPLGAHGGWWSTFKHSARSSLIPITSTASTNSASIIPYLFTTSTAVRPGSSDVPDHRGTSTAGLQTTSVEVTSSTGAPVSVPLTVLSAGVRPSSSEAVAPTTTTSTGTGIIAVSSDMSTSSTSAAADEGARDTASGNKNSTSGLGSSSTLTITLSAVLSVVGVLVLVGGLFVCLKFRKRRVRFLKRGVSPIDDDEIATWKAAGDEKAALAESGAEAGVAASPPRASKHMTQPSASSIKKPPSVIVYNGRTSQQLPRRSGESSPRSIRLDNSTQNGKTSLDRGLPQIPIQAVAPNARAGLTDDAIPGDDPFIIPSPKRHTSRLSKIQPHASYTSPRSGPHAHLRTRSSRSSTRSYGGDYSSDMELSPRTSNDYYSNVHGSRVYSSNAMPPRLSLRDESELGGLSPRPLSHESNMIGRAIG